MARHASLQHAIALLLSLCIAGLVLYSRDRIVATQRVDRLQLETKAMGSLVESVSSKGVVMSGATLIGILDARAKRLLTDPKVLKIFHFGRFDIAMFALHLEVTTAPVYCTKIASKLARTYTDRHGLKDVTRELVGVDISKAQQSSDWGQARLTPEQIAYAASDVLNLHALKTRLDAMLLREGRMELAQACFDFLPWRARLDLAGWEDADVFAHS